jgi:excisionase family DNA binding protein
MSMRPPLSVPEASDELALSQQRVRKLIYDGVLPASKIGDSWAVDRSAVHLLARKKQRPGRPLNASNAWAALALLAGEHPAWLRPDVRSRLRRRLENPGWIDSALEAAEDRSSIAWLWLPSHDLRRLAKEFPLVRSGLSAKEAGLDLLRYREDAVDAYVPEEILSGIERRFLPERASASDANAILRVPTIPWVLQRHPEAPPAVVAADLLGHRDPRVDRAARERLRALARGV